MFWESTSVLPQRGPPLYVPMAIGVLIAGQRTEAQVVSLGQQLE